MTTSLAHASAKVADEVWIATALLHREHPGRLDFTIAEIGGRADLFITNDSHLARKIVPGIQFIVGLGNAPI